MIEQHSIDALKSRLDIIEVVQSYLDLRKSGANWLGICPFHNDTKPSLHVNQTKQIYHCFACGAGGDSIKFVMEYDKLNYPEAIEKLASMYNFSLTYTKENTQFLNQKKVLEQIDQYYKSLLKTNQNALNYLKNRGMSDKSIEKWGLGWAPNSAMSLEFLQKNAINFSEARQLGVADTGNNGAYARFIERITFPIHGSNGKLLGFGGRTISNHPAKYINSPETSLFNKSSILYGYYFAKEQILKSEQIIVTEGYLDVIFLHQAGFTNAVATLGTALTLQHLPLLSRGNPHILLSYDGDNAGINAAFKAAKLLSSHGKNGGVVIFDQGLDPADLVAKNDIQKLKQIYAKPINFVDFVLKHIISTFNLHDPYEKQQATLQTSEYLSSLPKIIANEYRGKLAFMLNLPENLLPKSKNLQKNDRAIKQKREDYSELSIIKTALEKEELKSLIFECLDETYMRFHSVEFAMCLQGKINAYLREILLREDIKTLNENELINAIANLKIAHIQKEIEKIKSDETLSFLQKANACQELKLQIKQIQNKEKL